MLLQSKVLYSLPLTCKPTPRVKKFPARSLATPIFLVLRTRSPAASLQIAYTLDVFGAIRRQIEGFEAQAEYQRFQLEGAFLTLASNVVTTAIQEASLRAQIDATEEIIKAQTRQLDLVKQQFELGAASKVDVLGLQSTLEQTRTTLPPLQQQLARDTPSFDRIGG